MKAVVIEHFGGLEEVKMADVPRPTPAKGEVLIRIRDAGVNPVDWKIGEGALKEKLPHEFPLILGWDAAGEIAEVGDGVKGFKAGDAVFAYCRKQVVRHGTFAEYIALDAKYVALKPKTLNFAEAAAIPLVALTAWQSLFDFAHLKEGDTVFISAGAGGVGSFAIQFAKWKKAKVYTTASPNHHAYVKSLGADHVIDYNKEDFAKVIMQKEPKGLDVVYDCVGGSTLRASFPLVKKGGTLVSIVNFNVEELGKPYPIRSGFVFVAPNGEQLATIAGLIDKGAVKSAHIEELKLEDAVLALKKVKEGHTQGKIVLKVS